LLEKLSEAILNVHGQWICHKDCPEEQEQVMFQRFALLLFMFTTGGGSNVPACPDDSDL